MKIFTEQIISTLDTCDNVVSLYLGFIKIYKEIQTAQPWLETITIEIDKTLNSLEFYYYCEDTHSEDCILISIGKEYSFIYRESDSWKLNDKYLDHRMIAEHLMSWKCLRLPLKVIEVKNLILEGYWKFDRNIVPKLVSKIPIDVRELISWDAKCVLNATNKDNLCVISREEWNEIVNNENKFSE